SPRRRKVRISLSQPAQRGAEIALAPLWRNSTRSLPTTRGAGERPSLRTPGGSDRPRASRGGAARRGATAVTASPASKAETLGSAAQTRPTARPTGPVATSEDGV